MSVSTRHPGARLHARIYVAVLASVAMVALLSGAAWHLYYGREPVGSGLDLAADVASELLGPADAPAARQEALLRRWGTRTSSRLSLFTATR